MRLTTILVCAAFLTHAAESLAAWQGKQAAGDAAAVAPDHSAHRRGGSERKNWTQYPLIAPAMSGRGANRSGAAFVAKNLEAPELLVYAPGSEGPGAQWRVPLTPEGAQVKVSPKVGNYHWIAAREEMEGHVAVASTVHFFSNPGPAPTQLLLTHKNELEIIPQPLPREHGRYRENETWKFLLRFNGQPLAGKEVALETEFGTKARFVSDERGMVKVKFPHDFPAEQEHQGKGAEGHHAGPRSAKFVLAAEHLDSGRHYVTAFNLSYSPDAYEGKNLAAGAGFALFGMLLAAPLLRRRKPAQQGEK